MDEDDAVTISSESGGTDIVAPETSQATVDSKTPKRAVFATVLATLLFMGLLGVAGWATVQRSWSFGQPWWYGLQLRYVATPIAAFTAALVAITTAWWSVGSARETRAAEHERWEEDRDNENSRRVAERRDSIERTLRDRFHELVKLLASDELRAREGAAYAVAALADDWKAHYRNDPTKAQAEQQVCVDVLVSQLRDPLPSSSDAAAHAQLIAFKHTAQKIISSRFGLVDRDERRPGVWSSADLIFDGCTFHNLTLDGCLVTGDKVSFEGARFGPENLSLDGLPFTGPKVSFNGAHFATDLVSFEGARFTADEMSFSGAHFTSTRVLFDGAKFTGLVVDFMGSRFVGKRVLFRNTRFDAGVHFDAALLLAERVSLDFATFTKRYVSFECAHFSGKDVSFRNTQFPEEEVSFDGTQFAANRSLVAGAQLPEFDLAQFTAAPVSLPGCEKCNKLIELRRLAKEARPGSS